MMSSFFYKTLMAASAALMPSRYSMWSAIAISIAFGLAITGLNAQTTSDSSVFGVFAGNSPSGEAIRPLLQIPPDAKADLIQWRLALYQDAKTLAPTRYQLHCDYGPAVPGLPGLGTRRTTVKKEGSWTIGSGIKSNPKAVVYELDGAMSLFKVHPDILHVLNRDRSLMIGNGGWSYTLYRTEASEKPGDPSVTSGSGDDSRTISPLASGPSVFGVFEGRSPCLGIARDLKIDVTGGCIKVKWRVTLYQNPETRLPSTYKVEDSLHRQGARKGNWTILRGTETDPNAIVYRLFPTKTEAALHLLKGDDNVLFFLNQELEPLVGHSEFSYTLNRRTEGVPGEFQICPHLRPRVQDELSQSFDFPIFKRGNQIETGLFKANVLV